MISKRNIIILSLLFILLGIEIIIVAPQELGDSAPTANSKSTLTSEKKGSGKVMEGVRLVGAKGERKEWELFADRALQKDEKSEWTIEKVKVKFNGENGVFYTVTGDSGSVDTEKNAVRIAGNVVTTSSNGYVFKSPSMFYDSIARVLSCTETVEMVGPKTENEEPLSLKGGSMLADMKSNEIQVNKNVQARRQIKENKVALIVSEQAIFSGRSNSARFLGDVTIDIEGVRMSGSEATFVHKKSGGGLESLVVNGGVRVTDTDKWATSDRVSVFFDEDKFVFNGTPRVVQNGDELRGDEIIFLNGGRKVQVSNAHAKLDPNELETKKRIGN